MIVNEKSSVYINPRDRASVLAMLDQLSGAEANKANVRGINRTLTGVRTDGVRILSDHYALTASAIRESWKISQARFDDPSGVVGSQGTFIRLVKFGARQNKTGVSVKVLQKNPRATIAHAFIAKLKNNQSEDQVYWRKWKGFRKKPVAGRNYAAMPMQYRFPVKALYGPRIQDYLGDPGIIDTLTAMAGERLSKNMKHEVEYLLSQVK
jgi:hypothetical protein